MIRKEFDGVFRDFVSALQIKVVAAQADLYWETYKHYHLDDFRLACNQLGMGTPGKFPSASFFRDNIEAAKEMRLEKEKGYQKRAVENLMRFGPKASDNPNESLWAKCCCAIVLHEPKHAAQFIRECFENEAFLRWCESWETEGKENAKFWLVRQLERVENSAKNLQDRICV